MIVQKKALIIGASIDSIHTIEVAQKQGIYVIAIDGNKNAAGLSYADEHYVIDISDTKKVYDIVKRVQPDFILPIPIGRYLSVMGYINEEFSMPGIGFEPINCSVDKYLFHEKLSKCGLRNIKSLLIDSQTEVNKIDMNYPAILKPRFGSGSRDVFYIQNKEEFEKICRIKGSFSEDYILEQAVSGEEYGVDGAVIEGQFYLILIRKKINTELPERQAIAYFSVPIQEEQLYSNVANYIKNVSQALEYNNCLLHADIIIHDDQVFVIEISPRPSGHNLHNLFVPLATGIDMAEEYVKYVIGEKYLFRTENVRTLQIRYFDFSDVIVTYVPSLEELEKKCKILVWNCNIKAGDKLEKVTNGKSIMGRGFFIIEGKNEEELIKNSNWILEQFKFGGK